MHLRSLAHCSQTVRIAISRKCSFPSPIRLFSSETEPVIPLNKSLNDFPATLVPFSLCHDRKLPEDLAKREEEIADFMKLSLARGQQINQAEARPLFDFLLSGGEEKLFDNIGSFLISDSPEAFHEGLKSSYESLVEEYNAAAKKAFETGKVSFDPELNICTETLQKLFQASLEDWLEAGLMPQVKVHSVKTRIVSIHPKAVKKGIMSSIIRLFSKDLAESFDALSAYSTSHVTPLKMTVHVTSEETLEVRNPQGQLVDVSITDSTEHEKPSSEREPLDDLMEQLRLKQLNSFVELFSNTNKPIFQHHLVIYTTPCVPSKLLEELFEEVAIATDPSSKLTPKTEARDSLRWKIFDFNGSVFLRKMMSSL